MSDARIHLVVLFGGQSAEHDVSCTTAAHVLRAADPTKYRITAVGIDRNGAWHLADAAMRALESGPDALPGRLVPGGTPIAAGSALTAAGTTVVLPLLHGPLGEDGTVQGLLELLDLPYVGSGVLGSAVSMDKAMAKEVLAQHGVAQTRWRSLRADQLRPGTAADLVDELGLPLFVKPANMGSSVGVSKAKSVEDVGIALTHAFAYDEWVVVEAGVDCREIEVAVLGNLDPRASVPGEVIPGREFYDYEDKYVEDGAQLLIPAPLSAAQTAEVQALAVECFRALRCEGMARVDFFLERDTGRFLCNEINTIPGFTPISMYPKMWIASGMTYTGLIDELVSLALERHRRRRRNTSR
jgi:D-alanine-D-alanine ligase